VGSGDNSRQQQKTGPSSFLLMGRAVSSAKNRTTTPSSSSSLSVVHLSVAVEVADVHLKVKVHPLEAVEEVHERLRDVGLHHAQQADELQLEAHQLREEEEEGGGQRKEWQRETQRPTHTNGK